MRKSKGFLKIIVNCNKQNKVALDLKKMSKNIANFEAAGSIHQFRNPCFQYPDPSLILLKI